MFKQYYNLTKPGIIYGNAVTAIAGFFLASRGHFDLRIFITMLLGLSFVIGSGCVLNNLMDRGIDARMTRTKSRATVTGEISTRKAIVYGIVLGLVGAALLYFYTNALTLTVALVGWIVYVGIYTPMKPRSMHATLVGSIAGAVPPVVGYAAVTGKLDLGALVLFLILVCWQMPHFYAIAIRRLDEYQEARVPVLPVKKGIFATKINIVAYILFFIVATILLTTLHYTGYVYLTIALLLGVTWLLFALQGFKSGIDNKLWARKLFLFSLVVLMTLSITISISGIMHS